MRPFFRARTVALLCAACLLPSLSFAQADDYPNRPIKLLVPWATGGATDSLARLIGQKLSIRLKQPVVVDNKAGAGGTIGTSAFTKEKPDGYSLLMATSSANVAGPYLYAKPGFDPIKDFTPVAYVALIPNVLEVSAKSRFTSAQELIAEAKKNPGTVNYGSGGNGSSQHLSSSLLKKVAGIDIIHVPYKGSGPALTDLMGGQVDFILDTGSLGHVKSGNLKALAVASSKRLPALPEVPTFAELGYKDMIASAWYGVLAPAGLPKPIQDKLNVEINAVLKDPDTRKQIEMTLGGIVSDGESPAWFGDFVKSELKRYAEIVKISGAKAE